MLRSLIICGIIAVFAFACSSVESGDVKDSAACAVKPVNPNGDSELAILMREMADWTDSCRSAILNGKEIPPKPAGIVNLKTATRTDQTINESIFLSMATLYESKVQTFAVTDAANTVAHYNDMVTGCKSCHENFCQGPLTRINKMYIEAN